MAYKGLYENEGIPEEEVKARVDQISDRILNMITDTGLVDLVYMVLYHDGMELCESVGSSTKHHNYCGGLMDHTMEVVKIARAMGECFPGKVNMDLITAGAFLHDIGKIVSYADKPNLKNGNRPKVRFQRSEEDKIMGHFGEALTMLEALIVHEDINIDNDLKRQLYHIIASHHGESRLNWGSVTDPVTNEAHIVALADLLSSRIK